MTRAPFWMVMLLAVVQASTLAQRTSDGLTHNITASNPASIRSNSVLVLLRGVPVLYDASTGTESVRLKGLQDPVFGMSLSPDGRRIATTTSNAQADFNPSPLRADIEVWDAASGKLLWQTSVTFAARPMWTADSRRVVLSQYATKDATKTREWDAASGREKPGYDGVVSFDISGHTTVVMQKNRLTLIAGSSRRPRCEISGESGVTIETPLFAQDGRKITAMVRMAADPRLPDSQANREVRVWSTETCNLLGSYKVKGGSFARPSFTPDGRGLLINLSGPAVAEVLDVDTGAVMKDFRPAPAQFVLDAQLSGDGRSLLTRSSFYRGRDRPSCTLWRVSDGRALHVWDEEYDGRGCAGFTGDGENVILLGANESVSLWSATTGELVRGDATAAH